MSSRSEKESILGKCTHFVLKEAILQCLVSRVTASSFKEEFIFLKTGRGHDGLRTERRCSVSWSLLYWPISGKAIRDCTHLIAG